MMKGSCYACGTVGHHRDKCPAEKKVKDEKWLYDNIPDSPLPRSVSNIDQIIGFFNQSLFRKGAEVYLKLHTKDKIIDGSVFQDNLSLYSNRYGNKILSMPIGEFIGFLEQKGSIEKISLNTYKDDDLVGMVKFLESVDIAKCEYTGKKSSKTSIYSKVVMLSQDQRGWEHRITDELLIKQVYTKFMSNYNLEIDVVSE